MNRVSRSIMVVGETVASYTITVDDVRQVVAAFKAKKWNVPVVLAFSTQHVIGIVLELDLSDDGQQAVADMAFTVNSPPEGAAAPMLRAVLTPNRFVIDELMAVSYGG